jgi:hypothetical protein
MSDDLSVWGEDYEDYLEFYDDDDGKRRKLSKREFCELSEEMNDLCVWSNIRELTPGERHQMTELEYLLMG